MLDILFNEKFYIKTFGCQMNIHDSERIAKTLADAFGLELAAEEQEASLIILNTCAIREKAVHKVHSMIGQIRKTYAAKGLNPVIGIGGCVPQIEDDQLKRNQEINFQFGPDAIDQIPIILKRLNDGERRLIVNGFEAESQSYDIETKVYAHKRMAYVNVIKGCNNFCTFCIVPFTRGKEKSRLLNDVVSDVIRLVANGIVEVCLLGQNVNSFGKENGETFADLLRNLGQVKGLKRLRFITSNPQDLSDELISCFVPGEVPNLMPYFHLPIQSGNDLILKRMKRQYSRAHYLERIDALRRARPDIAISTDIIVGFPGETEAMFADTMTIIEAVRYDQVFSFIYSKRLKTPATRIKDTVTLAEKKQRLYALQARTSEIIGEKNRLLIGKKTTAFLGRTPENRAIHFANEQQLANQFVALEVVESTAASLRGKLIRVLPEDPSSQLGAELAAPQLINIRY